jgi:hypothetical protein
MVAALVGFSTHIQAHHLPVLNQGELATLEEVYQRGVQGPRGHVRSQGCFMAEKFFGSSCYKLRSRVSLCSMEVLRA